MQRTPYDQEQDSRTQAGSLTTDQVKGCRERYAEGWTLSELAYKYNVSRSTIYRIVKYETYSSLARGYTSQCLSRLEQNRKNQGLSSYKVQLSYHYGLAVNGLADLYDVSERTIYRKLEG